MKLFVNNYDGGPTFPGIIVMCILLVAGIFGLAVAGTYWQETAKCDNLHRLMGVETFVSVTTDCMIKYKGDWVSGTSAMHQQYEVRGKNDHR